MALDLVSAHVGSFRSEAQQIKQKGPMTKFLRLAIFSCDISARNAFVNTPMIHFFYWLLYEIEWSKLVATDKRRPIAYKNFFISIERSLDYSLFFFTRRSTSGNEETFFFHFHHITVRRQMFCTHKRVHLRLGALVGTGQSTARIASSNTVFSPFCVNAEHSRYFTAPTSFAIANP